MAWTYTNNPTGVKRDEVRLLIGDIDTNDQQVTDEAISHWLTQFNNNAYYAAEAAALSIASRYARKVDTKIESVSMNYGALVDNYTKLAAKLKIQGKENAATGNMLSAAPVVTGITISEADSLAEDADLRQPAFRTDMFDVRRTDIEPVDGCPC